MPLITEYPKYDNSLYPKEYSNFSYKRQLLLYRIHDDFFAVNNFSMRRLIVFGFYLNRGLIIDTLRLCIIYRNEFEDKISKFKHELFAVYFFRKLIISAVKDLKHNAQ